MDALSYVEKEELEYGMERLEDGLEGREVESAAKSVEGVEDRHHFD